MLYEEQLNRDNTLVNIEVQFRNISLSKGACISSHEFQLELFVTCTHVSHTAGAFVTGVIFSGLQDTSYPCIRNLSVLYLTQVLEMMTTTTELLLMDAGQYNAELPQWASLSSGGGNKNSDLFHRETNQKLSSLNRDTREGYYLEIVTP